VRLAVVGVSAILVTVLAGLRRVLEFTILSDLGLVEDTSQRALLGHHGFTGLCSSRLETGLQVVDITLLDGGQRFTVGGHWKKGGEIVGRGCW
jgi:hypothetical protein